MDGVGLKADPNFYESSHLSAENWEIIATFAADRFANFRALTLTCHTLRTLVSQPKALKSLFQHPIPSPLPTQALEFLKHYLTPEQSAGLELDFTYGRQALSQDDLTTIFNSFPKIAKLNLCMLISSFPMSRFTPWDGFRELELAAKQIHWPSHTVEVSVWNMTSLDFSIRIALLQVEYPSLKLVLVKRPPLRPFFNNPFNNSLYLATSFSF